MNTLRFTFVVSALVALCCGFGSGCGDDDGTACSSPDVIGTPPGGACVADTDCAAVGTNDGVCVAGVCGVASSDGGCASDGARTGCPSGFKCRQLVVESGTYGACMPDCGCGACEGACDAELSCLPTATQSCDPRVCTVARGPVPICKTPPALGAGPYYTNVTVEANLAADGADVVGNRLAVADLNEDGYPDVVVHKTGGMRFDLQGEPGTWNKRVLINAAGTGGARQFEDFTEASGLTATRDGSTFARASHLSVFADVNNDGHLDVYSGTHVKDDATDDPGDRSEIFLGNGDGTFELAPQSDTTPPNGERRAPTSAAFLDYNLDGRIDLFVGFDYGIYGYPGSAQQDRLFRGDGTGAFSDVTGPAGLTTTPGAYGSGMNPRPTWGVTVCDVDSDGDPDLITSSYGRQTNMLWKNLNGSEFENVAPQVGYAMDEGVDYSDNQFFRCHCQLAPNSPDCDPNPGPPSIVCSADYWGTGTDDQPWRLGGNTFTTLCGDIDNDGDMDLYTNEIRHWHIGSSSDPSELLLNDGNGESWRFERPGNSIMGLERSWPTDWNEGDITSVFLDFDNDGLLDIYLGCSDYPYTHDFLFRQRGGHTFEDVSAASGADHYYGNSVATLDYDRDGDLDLLVGSSTMRCSSDPACTWTRAEVHLYRNDVGQDSNWMAVRLVGAGDGASNVSAIGARIVVTAGGVSQTREVQGGYGHFGLQQPLTQYFGLGGMCLAETVEIRWPNLSQTVTTLSWVPANYFITIHEADGSITYEPAP